VGLLFAGDFAEAADLKWGRSAQPRQLTKSANLQFRRASSSRDAVVTRDAKVVTVAWEEDVPVAGNRSIVVERPTTQEPQFVAQLPEDPFADVDDDLLPEIDTEEPAESFDNSTEESEEQPEPTLDDLFEDEPATDEPSDDMSEEDLQDDLFGTDESETESEAETEEMEEPEEEAEEAPESNDSADDPFDEPSIDQLPTERMEPLLDNEIQPRMEEQEPGAPAEPKNPLDSLNTSDLFEKELGEEMPADADGSKLFGNDAKNFDLEIGEPADSYELTDAERQEQLEQLAKERRQSEKNCKNEFAKMKSDRIGDIDLSLHVDGNPGEDFPYECIVGFSKHQPRQWTQITYNWKASGLCHKPLYFEQVQLERYGHSWGPHFQPIMSGLHFFGTIPILPYKMGIRTPTECVYTLGYYRPGSCAPYMIDPVPFTWRAALFQGGFTTGMIFAIP